MSKVVVYAMRYASVIFKKGFKYAGKVYKKIPFKSILATMGLDYAVQSIVDSIDESSKEKDEQEKAAFNAIFLPGDDLMRLLVDVDRYDVDSMMNFLNNKYMRLTSSTENVELLKNHVLMVQEYLYKTNGCSYLLRQMDELKPIIQYISGLPADAVVESELVGDFSIMADYVFLVITKAGVSPSLAAGDIDELIAAMVNSNAIDPGESTADVKSRESSSLSNDKTGTAKEQKFKVITNALKESIA